MEPCSQALNASGVIVGAMELGRWLELLSTNIYTLLEVKRQREVLVEMKLWEQNVWQSGIELNTISS